MGGWAMGIAVYFVTWWITLFMVLPWGVKPIDEEDVRKGQASSAPKKPMLLIKVAANTVLAGVVWLILYWVIQSGLISIRP